MAVNKSQPSLVLNMNLNEPDLRVSCLALFYIYRSKSLHACGCLGKVDATLLLRARHVVYTICSPTTVVHSYLHIYTVS